MDAGQLDAGARRAAGETNVKVPSVTNFVVGDTIQVGSATAKITAVGTQSRTTTLFAPAAVGDTNVKVAATTGLAAGDELRIGEQTVTITTVGTQGRATTLAAAAAAGATNLRVASVTGLVANSTITVGGQTVQVTTVGTQGANGTGLTLAAAARRGRGQRRRRALRRHRRHVHARADRRARARRDVLAPGTGITIDAPLAAAQAAGATVRSTPGAITGDRVGFNGVGMSGSRAENFTISAPGRVGNAANMMQGGERFQTISLTTPGTLELSAVGIDFRHPNASRRRLRGLLPLQRHQAQQDLVPGRVHQRHQLGADRRRARPDDPGDPRRRQARPPAVERRPGPAGPHRVHQPRLRREGLGLHQGHAAPVRRHPGRRRPHLRPHPELDGVAAERRLLLDELLDVPRAQRRRPTTCTRPTSSSCARSTRSSSASSPTTARSSIRRSAC